MTSPIIKKNMNNAKKMAVFEVLQKAATPLDLPLLLQTLGTAYAERSVRRWLSEMVAEGLIQKSGHKRGTRYYIDSRLGGLTTESLQLVAKVRRPLFERDLVAYADEWIKSYRPNKTSYIPQSVQTQLYQAGQRSQTADLAGTYAHKIFNRLLLDLSYNSSRLEGNTYSLLETQRLLLEGKSVAGKLDEEKIMILNHKEAIRYLVDNAPRLKLSVETICTVHYLLSDGLLEWQYSGKLRDYGVRIGGSVYVPCENKTVLQSHLNIILEKAVQIENPYEQSFFLLIHLSYLQGFADVNKRTARLCANIPLIQKNLVPLVFKDIKKEDYSATMRVVYELQDIRPLLELYTFSYLRTCSQYDVTIQELNFDAIRVRYREQRRTLIREIIVQCLSGKALDTYLQQQAPLQVPAADVAAFIMKVQEDLKAMDASRMVGLGITPEQLQIWLAAQ